MTGSGGHALNEQVLSSHLFYFKYIVINILCLGCLITADGSDDNLIRPEGLKDYEVKRPDILFDKDDLVDNVQITPMPKHCPELDLVPIEDLFSPEQGV